MNEQFWVGVIASTLAFFLKDLWLQKRRRREYLESVADDCALAAHELGYCIGKLGPLRNKCNEVAGDIQRGVVSVPSYRLNTESLVAACSQLAKGRLLEAELRGRLSECCFQVTHVSRRLDEHIAQVPALDVNKKLGLKMAAANWRGLEGLCAEVIELLQQAVSEVQRIERQIRATLERYELWSGKNLAIRVRSEIV